MRSIIWLIGLEFLSSLSRHWGEQFHITDNATSTIAVIFLIYMAMDIADVVSKFINRREL